MKKKVHVHTFCLTDSILFNDLIWNSLFLLLLRFFPVLLKNKLRTFSFLFLIMFDFDSLFGTFSLDLFYNFDKILRKFKKISRRFQIFFNYVRYLC